MKMSMFKDKQSLMNLIFSICSDFGKTFVVLRTKQTNSSSSASGEVQLPRLKQTSAVRSDSDG